MIRSAKDERHQSLKTWIAKGRRPVWTAVLISILIGISLFAFIQSQGATSSLQNGSSSLLSHAPILIVGNSQFLPFNGVTGGTGTSSDPYIIQGWDIAPGAAAGLLVRNTTAYFVIRNVYVHDGHEGIVFDNVSNSQITNVTASGSPRNLSISRSTNILVSKNLILNTLGFPIGENSLYSSSSITFSYNNISSATNCLNLSSGTTIITITGNNFSNCYANGVIISDSASSSITLTRDNFVNCTNAFSQAGNRVNFSGNTILNGGLSFGGSNAIATRNQISSNFWGINVGGYNTTFSDNDVSNISVGIQVGGYNVTIARNTFTDGGLKLNGPFGNYSITTDNLFGGKPLYYYQNCNGLDLDGSLSPWVNGIATLILAHCKNVRVSNLQIGRTLIALQLYFVVDANITGNTFFQNQFYGILLTDSSNIGFMGNSLSNNYAGLGIFNVNNTSVYHNNFLNNGRQTVQLAGTGWSWDNGYPRGGNYWSDYRAADNCSGPVQNICTGPDGIGDVAYVIDSTNQDHYPLMARVHVSSSSVQWPSGSSLVATSLDSTSVLLEWTSPATSSDIFGYRIYQGSLLLATLGKNTTQFRVTGLAPGEKYTFRVEAGDASGGWSTTGPSLTVTTQPSSPLFPLPPPQYWYIPVGGVLGIVALAFVLRRRSKRERGGPSGAKVLP